MNLAASQTADCLAEPNGQPSQAAQVGRDAALLQACIDQDVDPMDRKQVQKAEPGDENPWPLVQGSQDLHAVVDTLSHDILDLSDVAKQRGMPSCDG